MEGDPLFPHSSPSWGEGRLPTKTGLYWKIPPLKCSCGNVDLPKCRSATHGGWERLTRLCPSAPPCSAPATDSSGSPVFQNFTWAPRSWDRAAGGTGDTWEWPCPTRAQLSQHSRGCVPVPPAGPEAAPELTCSSLTQLPSPSYSSTREPTPTEWSRRNPSLLSRESPQQLGAPWILTLARRYCSSLANHADTQNDKPDSTDTCQPAPPDVLSEYQKHHLMEGTNTTCRDSVPGPGTAPFPPEPRESCGTGSRARSCWPRGQGTALPLGGVTEALQGKSDIAASQDTHTLPPETAGAVELFSTKLFTFQLHGLSQSLPRQSRALSLSAGSPLTLCAHSLHRTKAQLRVAAVLYHLLNFSKLIKFLKPTALAQGQQPVSPVPGRI